MKKILVLTDYYLPGYKAGGLVRAVANLIDQLGDEYNFSIITRDHDMGSIESYPGVLAGEWHNVGKAQVRYLASRERALSAWKRVFEAIDCDLIYINGFFTRQCINTLLLRKLRQIRYCPVVVAPRGSLLSGNLSVKAYKKIPFLAISHMFQLFSEVVWQASTEIEASSIRVQFGRDIRQGRSSLTIAPELVSPPPETITEHPNKLPGSARLVFISRVAPEKNLHLVLELLSKVSGQVQFDIYGVIDDNSYWRDCEVLIAHLPPNIKVEYKGTVDPSHVHETFARYHLSVLLAQGESFSFAILESLCAGCPVLISDRTPWQDLQEKEVGWVIPLDQTPEFLRRLREVIDMDQLTFTRMSQTARTYGRDYIENNNQIEASRQLFNSSLQVRKHR